MGKSHMRVLPAPVAEGAFDHSKNNRLAGFKKRAKRIKFSAYVSYLAIVALILSVVSIGYQSPVQQNAIGSARVAFATAPSVDQVAAAELAVTAAQTANLAVAGNVESLSYSLSAKSALAQTDESVISKPQLVQTVNVRGVRSYQAKAGDTVPAVAASLGVSADTVRWANSLTSDALSPGQVLKVPPVNGLIYTVKPGDTPDSLAAKYKADRARIVTFNDAELSGLKPGQAIIIPGGTLPTNERPGYQAPATSLRYGSSAGFSLLPNAGVSVGNRYAYGYCTYWVYNRRAQLGRPVGSYWGDAVTWDDYARAAGYRVDKTPEVGAVLQDPTIAPPYGHVAVVEKIGADGSVTVSEMNYVGWNIISSRTISAAQARGYTYIH
ncbi:MAG: LysM peptidoglycan-binding domain-containing protein [Candidatus Chaera renei]|uniref:LysM peptidoglycan-binding domain-containing protein n=1 Tax=Candidatus Chaera renei TaxID=2506947 RepID=A0A4Q0AIX3_9BACT|nr:MAG: LysM peptidoglycan-binding domain-containing protein [Candidatus Chaera renei]